MHAAEDSATLAASCPVAMNIAVMPFAEWAPLLLTPDMNPPRFDTCRARYISRESERMILWNSSLGIVASATTRLPRVRSMLTCELFLSVAKFDSRKKCSMGGQCSVIHLHAACVALPVRFWPAASPVV